MADFNLDLRAAEEFIDDESDGETPIQVELGILDGTTPPEEWTDAVEDGHVLVLDIDGDLNELAAPFAREIKDDGGQLIRFRGFLIISPPGIDIDTDRLSG